MILCGYVQYRFFFDFISFSSSPFLILPGVQHVFLLPQAATTVLLYRTGIVHNNRDERGVYNVEIINL